MAKAVATRSIDLESIDRLEEKLKLLVGLVERLRVERGRACRRRTAGWCASSTRRWPGSTTPRASGAEMRALREERDVIRSRVNEMLPQIERSTCRQRRERRFIVTRGRGLVMGRA